MIVRTVLRPDEDVDVPEAEAASLAAMGLLAPIPRTAPEPVSEPAPESQPSPRPRARTVPADPPDGPPQDDTGDPAMTTKAEG